jgi:hypothetical protein
MIWDGLKNIFGQKPQAAAKRSDIEVPWIEASQNPWGVRLLDVRPITLTMLSTSQDPLCAQNAVSYGRDDGASFIGQTPSADRIIDLDLRFPIDRMLPDGVLFAPRQMEHKWALFLREGRLIFVRSWTRTVYATAEVERHSDHIVLRSLRGALISEDEPVELSARVVDFLLQTHVLELDYPAPLPPGMSEAPQSAALWCMSSFGNRASFATEEAFRRVEPTKPLRSHSLLHISVARSDSEAVQRYLRDGIPIDLLAGDGLAPLHWALASKDGQVLELLLSSGAQVDVRSDQGSTPLMLAVQARRLDQTRLLLDRGADANAADDRGFTSLHRAAEMGQLEVAKLLLDHGASPTATAAGQTPISLAHQRGEKAMEALLT